MRTTPHKEKKLRIAVALFALFALLMAFALLRDDADLISAKEAERILHEGRITSPAIKENYLYFYDTKRKSAYKTYAPSIEPALLKHYTLSTKENRRSIIGYIFLLSALGALGYLLFARFFTKGKKHRADDALRFAKEALSFGEGSHIKAQRSQLSFDDVAGIDEAKEELEEIVDFLKRPAYYKKHGIRLPKGVLLAGPPGVGKTLIAKALAGEADVPFFYHSGASFAELYVGAGPKRVRELFAKAKREAPAIIFIDEIDAVGKRRGESRSDEREATLNQLLTEMDGFEESSGVIVIAATNTLEAIDEALLRPGRFDRRILLSLPDFEERKKILAHYLRNKRHEVDIDSVARGCVGFSAAALETLVNEAAIRALREGRTVLHTEDLTTLKTMVRFGKRRMPTYDASARKLFARYQGAKALAAAWLDIPFLKIDYLHTELAPSDPKLRTQTQLHNTLLFHLSGIVALRLTENDYFGFGDEDLREAETITKYLLESKRLFEEKAEDETQLLRRAMEECASLLTPLKAALDAFAQHLFESEQIDYETAKRLLKEYF